MYLSSISIELGTGILDHNNRKFIAENVDRERTKNNEEFKNISLEEAYHILFDNALQSYNDRQKRADRKIDNYLEHIQKSKQEKPFYEIIVQVGNHNDMGIGSRNEPIAKAILEDYMLSFEKQNPYLFVFNATLHMDEATPHLHIDFISFTTDSKRGLDTRVSMKQALEKQGFRGAGRSDTETMAWLQSEKESLASIMERHGVEWEHQGNEREHLSVLEYKKEQRSKEVVELENEIKSLITTAEDLTATVDRVTDISNNEAFEKEFTLPEPQRIESAKSYKNRIEGMFNKLKAFVKNVFIDLMKARRLNAELYSKNTSLGFANIDLQNSNRHYQKENLKLRKQLTDYRLLRNVLGKQQVDQILEAAKRPNRKERIKNYEQDFFR